MQRRSGRAALSAPLISAPLLVLIAPAAGDAALDASVGAIATQPRQSWKADPGTALA